MIAGSAEARISCGEVYANSVRNISIETRLAIEKDFLFNNHCSASGEISQSSSGFDFTATVKAIDVGFGGSQSDARQWMQSFCKEHLQTRDRQNELFRFDNTVVVDALNSLNQCRALEINETYITHVLVEPRAAILTVDFNRDKTNLRFRGITYDTAVADCWTTGLTDSGENLRLDNTTKEFDVKRSFSVICERKGTPTKEGSTKFERFVVGLDTNHGPYTVTMPLEELAGFDLGSEYKRNVLALGGEIQQLQSDKSSLTSAVNSLENRIANASAELHLIRTGEHPMGSYWEHLRCKRDLNDYVAKVCGTRKPQLRHLLTHGGNECGYGYYIYACVSTD
ncbi:hypothetical protein FHT70_006171 [Rhizobium sp. BK049]|uniref:hypothetical protein n=1 Tax=Rhizobium sp. BK049 TaxID=2587095 RepID=UPI001609BEA7|nr:hypothetical protein [Rhizobium sp. BK049]MBB3356191.1 hypothetical protein [Rhizobium sp. BK049]